MRIGITRNGRSVTCVVMACIVAACASSGGGGGGGPQSQPQPQPQPQPPPQQESVAAYWDTQVDGTVGRPARASFGANPSPAQTATNGGPTFDGSSGSYAFGDAPVTVSSLEATPSGLSAVSSNGGATVSFDTSNTNNYATLSIPALNLNVQLYWSPIDGLVDVLSYVVLGQWAEPASSGGKYGSISAFAFGYETPKTAMPTVGTATFSGPARATVLMPVDGEIRATLVAGAAGFSVDFASGTITGALTGMKQSDGVSYVTGSLWGVPGTLPWNDVSVTGSIAGGSNRFSGTTAATSAPGTTFSLKGSATGYIDGSFYGPNAENLGAIWSLSDGTASALGTVGAARDY